MADNEAKRDRDEMNANFARHHRQSIRIPGYDYASPGAYFVTLVTKDRACLFGQVAGDVMNLSEQGCMARQCWNAIPQHFPHVELDAYVVMPNHVHGILVLHDQTDKTGGAAARRGTIYRAPTRTAEGFQKPVVGSVATIIRTYKAAVTRLVARQYGGVPRIWQRNYFEHVIRDDVEWNRIRLYIEGNPSCWAEDDENQQLCP